MNSRFINHRNLSTSDNNNNTTNNIIPLSWYNHTNTINTIRPLSWYNPINQSKSYHSTTTTKDDNKSPITLKEFQDHYKYTKDIARKSLGNLTDKQFKYYYKKWNIKGWPHRRIISIRTRKEYIKDTINKYKNSKQNRIIILHNRFNNNNNNSSTINTITTTTTISINENINELVNNDELVKEFTSKINLLKNELNKVKEIENHIKNDPSNDEYYKKEMIKINIIS
jgi:hypothetical protein